MPHSRSPSTILSLCNSSHINCITTAFGNYRVSARAHAEIHSYVCLTLIQDNECYFVFLLIARYSLRSEIFQVCWSFPSPALPRGPVWDGLLHLPPQRSRWDVTAEQAGHEAPQPAAWSPGSQPRCSEVHHRCTHWHFISSWNRGEGASVAAGHVLANTVCRFDFWGELSSDRPEQIFLTLVVQYVSFFSEVLQVGCNLILHTFK